MKDPLNITPGDIVDMRREYELTVNRFLVSLDRDPDVALRKVNAMAETLSDMLLTNRDGMTQMDAGAAVAMMNLSITPIIIDKWRHLMRTRNPTPEKTNDEPLA